MKSLMLKKILLGFSVLWKSILIYLPDEFSKYRVRFYNKRGCKISSSATISPNVRIRGRFEMGSGSSIAQNCSIAGGNAGVYIGKNVMIAPNVSIIAFSHGYKYTNIPMVKQDNSEKSIVIEDDVWIAANCTIGKGVHIETGAIVSANSFVNKNVRAFSIVGGVPAAIIGNRKDGLS
jgi:acetyltransferase-like isoleucine patch superfamily enzyme